MTKSEINADILEVIGRFIGDRFDHQRSTPDTRRRVVDPLGRRRENRARLQRFVIGIVYLSVGTFLPQDRDPDILNGASKRLQQQFFGQDEYDRLAVG